MTTQGNGVDGHGDLIVTLTTRPLEILAGTSGVNVTSAISPGAGPRY